MTLTELIKSAKGFGIPEETFARVTWIKLIDIVETGVFMHEHELKYSFDSNVGKFAYIIYDVGDDTDARIEKN